MKKIINTNLAPKAIGPYSQAVIFGEQIFCSGQIALDPVTMELVGKSAAGQCEQVIKNLNSVLKAAGSDLSKILKTTIYLKDMNDFAGVNKMYGSFFPSDPPARATVQVARLPKDALIEIDCIAHT